MRLSTSRKLLYSVGSLGVTLSLYSFTAFIQFLYIDILGVAATYIGLGWSLYGIWNAINDPLAGYWSDNTKTRWGRRIPWILFGFLPLGVLYYLLWVQPAAVLRAGELGLVVYFMTVVLIFDTLWTLVVMNWTALFPEMVTDPVDRASVSGWRQFFTVVASLAAAILPPILVGADWSGRANMGLVFGVVTSLTLGLSLLGMRENPAAMAEKQPAFLPALKATVSSQPFRWYLSANLLKEFIFILLPASIPFWSKYVLRVQAPTTVAGVTLDVVTQTSLLTGLAFIMALPGLPLWTVVATRLGPTRGWQIAQATFAASMALLFFAGNFVQGAMGTALVGLSVAGLLVFPDQVIADVIDEDELVTGARREGMYFGMNGFVIRFAVTLQGLLTAGVLLWSGYVASTADNLYPAQPAAAVAGIRLLTTVLPALASLLVIVCLARYPLQGARLAAMRARRAAGAVPTQPVAATP